MSVFDSISCTAGSLTAPLNDQSDIPSFEKQVIRLADAGVGPLLAGSMGEAHHLSHAERITLVQAARKALDDSGHHKVPIIMGTGGGSTRETIQLSKEAAAAGADYTIVILSGYFAGALAGNKKALKTFWKDVSAASPLPVIVYNCQSILPTEHIGCDSMKLFRPRSSRRYRLGFGSHHRISPGMP